MKWIFDIRMDDELVAKGTFDNPADCVRECYRYCKMYAKDDSDFTNLSIDIKGVSDEVRQDDNGISEIDRELNGEGEDFNS